MLIHVKDLAADVLNYVVAKCEGEDYRSTTEYDGIGLEYPPHNYSNDWGQSGPIIARKHIRWNRSGGQYYAWIGGHEYIDPLHESIQDGVDPIKWYAFQFGNTILEACLRCYVQTVHGDHVDVPSANIP